MNATFTPTHVLWTRLFKTGPNTNETLFKDLLKSYLKIDANNGKISYTEQEILELFERCYDRVGSKAPANKAKQTWARYAKPGKEDWFSANNG